MHLLNNFFHAVSRGVSRGRSIYDFARLNNSEGVWCLLAGLHRNHLGLIALQNY